MIDDLRAAVRSFRHRRGVALTVVTMLALGIGANTAIFSAVDAVLLKPLPYPHPDRLVSVYELNRGQQQATQLLAPVRLEEWNRLNRTFAAIAGSYFENMTDTTGELPERVEGMRISPRFFSVVGVAAALGRTPRGDEERFGGPAVVVLSDAFWRRRFNANANAVGRAIVLSGVRRTVVGIMPPSFQYPSSTTDAWIPAQMGAGLASERRARLYTTIGRLNPGVTLVQAELDLTAVQVRLGEQFPDTDKGWGASLVPLREEQVGGIRRSLWLLFGAVALVLLAACGNVACLMLAEATRREHEIAVRFALGASRSLVVRQLLFEGLVLATTGAALGLVVSGWGTSLLRKATDQLPRVQDLHVDGRLVLFTLTLSAVTTILFGLAPALRATRCAPADALGRGGRGRIGGSYVLQRILVAAQIALAIVLLAGAGLLMRSFVRLQQVTPGFESNHVLTFRMSATWSERSDAVVSRYARTIVRLQAIPGVEAAAVSQVLPAGLAIPPGEVQIGGRDPSAKTFAHGRTVSSGYFRTLRIPILRGATCDEDQQGPVTTKAVVTRLFADRFFPEADPIGHTVRTPGFPPGHVMTIVGVVGNVRETGLLNPPEPVVYWCGYSGYWPDAHFLVRFDPARPVTNAALRTALLEIEPKRALYAVRPLAETLSLPVFQHRLNALLLALFAAMALTLSAVGLYGVMSQLTATRRREFGVRMALGARPSHVVSSVARQAALITAAGIVAGLTGALALARFMAALLFNVQPRDPLTFAMVPIVLALVAAVAALVPARRAAHVDPMEALRDD